MLRRLLGETIDLRSVIADQWAVKVDPGQLEQVLVNLAVNARDAMPQGGRLTIETADVELDEAYVRHHPGLTAGRFVLVAVSDTGHGFDEATRARVFEPFFTTKSKGHGTGLGLAMVHGFVKQSGGHISVYSEVGQGTTFKVYLPVTAEVPALPGDGRVAPAVGGTETVLLVEDEQLVRQFACKLLAGHGYTVHAFGLPAEAIAFVEAQDRAIDLIVTDVVMPGMNGRMLASRILGTHPQARVIYMSGYTDTAIVDHGLLEPGTVFLQKPVTADALLRKMREVLAT
jgi:CheY-like chemotaxis protein